MARQAGTDVRMTSEVVRKLEAKALLTREVDASDTRARRLRPTAAGARLARVAIEAVEQVDADFFEREPDLTPLLQRLLAARTNLEAGST